MPSGPQIVAIGMEEDKAMPIAVIRLCGQDAIGPSGVADQSNPAINRPISPLRARTAAKPAGMSAG